LIDSLKSSEAQIVAAMVQLSSDVWAIAVRPNERSASRRITNGSRIVIIMIIKE
jgi:hypothetical protein